MARNALQFRFCFNLNQHARIDQRANFDHRSARANVSEEFTMRTSVILPAADISDKHPGTDDIAQRPTCLSQRALDIADTLGCLLIRIVNTDNVAAVVCGGRAADMDSVSDANGAAVPDGGFPMGSRLNLLTVVWHGTRILSAASAETAYFAP